MIARTTATSGACLPVLGLCCVLVVASSCGVGSRLGDGVTKDGLLRLRPGLDEAQVVERLGPPLTRQEKGLSYLRR